MAEFQKKAHKNTRSKTKCFFGCFGFSGEDVDSGSRKKSRWFSWSKFRMKRPPTKTVPVESPGISNKPTENSIESRAPKAKSDKLVTSKRQNPDTSRKPQSQIPARKSDQDIMETPQQTKYGPKRITVQSVLEDRSRHFDSAKDDTCQERMMSFRWKRHCKKTVRSQPGSPISKFNSGPIGAVISHSTSVPARKTREKPRGNATVHPPETSSQTVGKFDTVVGMSIITLTLIIMILWGRLCAVLCMSAWFYFIPRLRTAAVETNSSRGVIDLDEYKKKVVLEGFLERNHRSNTGCSS